MGKFKFDFFLHVKGTIVDIYKFESMQWAAVRKCKEKPSILYLQLCPLAVKKRIKNRATYL